MGFLCCEYSQEVLPHGSKVAYWYMLIFWSLARPVKVSEVITKEGLVFKCCVFVKKRHSQLLLEDFVFKVDHLFFSCSLLKLLKLCYCYIARFVWSLAKPVKLSEVTPIRSLEVQAYTTWESLQTVRADCCVL